MPGVLQIVTLILYQVYDHVAKSNGDNCSLTSEHVHFETEELLVDDKASLISEYNNIVMLLPTSFLSASIKMCVFFFCLPLQAEKYITSYGSKQLRGQNCMVCVGQMRFLVNEDQPS